MLKYVVITAAAALSAVGAAAAVIGMDASRGGPTPVETAPQVMAARVETAAPAPQAPTAASIAKSKDGHYWADAQVNNSRVRFLVDTGASAVSLTAADAARLGFAPSSLDYRYKVMTANGESRGAKIKLASVSVAGARVTDVEALVIDKGLDTSLLGMTYLGRLARTEMTPTTLILRP